MIRLRLIIADVGYAITPWLPLPLSPPDALMLMIRLLMIITLP